MNAWTLPGLVAVVVGAFAGAPGVMLVGLVAVLVGGLRSLWSRFGLRRITYERHLGTDRAVWGDEIGLDVVVWNRKPLPLAWLQAEDQVDEGVTIRERPVVRGDRTDRAVLTHTWTLAWYERVVRHLHIVADHRGSFSLHGVRLRVADLFARDVAVEERPYRQTYVVRPRSVPVRREDLDRAPIGARRARASLFHDPALFSGVRPYQPGDPLRSVHWKATARLGAPVSKRFDPSRDREILLALDVQTVEGPYWNLVHDDDLSEALCVVAASLARAALAEGSACGLAAAGFSGVRERIAYLAPSGGAGQLGRISDTLARLSVNASAPFERLLSSLAHRISPGATLVTISALDPAGFLPVLRRLARSGFHVRHVVIGPHADAWARRVREAGIAANIAELQPDWRTADALVVVG
jgi:uncharacterized protein (DUF58 family)